jgi:hypothetical protein
MLHQISALFTSLMGHFRKTEFPPLASKSLLLAVVDGISSGLTSILAACQTDAFSPRSSDPSCFLAVRALLSPIWDRLQNVHDGLRTRIYTEQISASLQSGRDLDSCVFRQPVCVRAFLPEHLTGKHARLAGKT